MKLPSNRPEDLLPEHREAYEALPSSYKADSCLCFYIKGEMLLADHDLGGTYIWENNIWAEIASENGFI